MLEQVYDTIFAIIQNDLPKNAQGQCVIYDKPIISWMLGEQTVVGKTPAIILQSIGSTSKEIGQNTVEWEHKIACRFFIEQDTVDIGERNVLEFARSLREVLLPHRRIWVCMPCPFDGLQILSPEHYTIAHNDILGPYVTNALTEFSNTWYETHDLTTSVPTLPSSGIATESFNLMLSDVSANTPVTNMPAKALSVLQFAQTKKIRYIRLLEEVTFSDTKPSEENKEQQMLRGGEFTITAKEVIRLPAYGPDIVPTGAWTKRLKL